MAKRVRQAVIEAPVETVWDLIGNPSRHPEWWPRVIDIDGRRYEEGDEYVQVTRGPMGNEETRWLVEHKEDLREIKLRCLASGTYANWQMTGAQGGTFVEVRMGMDPLALSGRVFNMTIGPRFFRKWADESIDALRAVAKSAPGAASGGAQPVLADRGTSEPHQ